MISEKILDTTYFIELFEEFVCHNLINSIKDFALSSFFWRSAFYVSITRERFTLDILYLKIDFLIFICFRISHRISQRQKRRKLSRHRRPWNFVKNERLAYGRFTDEIHIKGSIWWFRQRLAFAATPWTVPTLKTIYRWALSSIGALREPIVRW
jgi:hypothetical protein